MRIDSDSFLEVVRPALHTGNAAALAQAVHARWRPGQICELLSDPRSDVRRVAAITLGLVGDSSVVPCLTKALHDEDPRVNEMAEHGLWSIWFRNCKGEACKTFKEGVALIAVEDYRRAIDHLRQAIKIDPGFAEAYNQCAIAHYFLDEYRQSLADCCRTVSLVPTHFGAIAGMGHCYMQLGDLDRARKCYRKAVMINPRMTALECAISRIDCTLRDKNDQSGEYRIVAS